MNIMIVGAGTVGYSLARTLSYRHNVTVIDKNRDTLHQLDEEIDVLVLHGDSENPKTYQTLQTESIDLFIAVTDSDEANLLSTLIVEDMIEVKRKIIRLKNDAFLQSHVLEKLSIDYAVFPDITTANKIKNLLTFPKANNVKTFHQTTYKLISIRLEMIQTKITLREICSDRLRIVGIEREKSFFIPSLDTLLLTGDLIYFFGDKEAIEKQIEDFDNTMPEYIQKVVIFGANTLAQKIAKILLEKGLNLKIIDKDKALCKKASEFLQGKATIINILHEEQELFKEEGFEKADMFIAAGQNDESNIIKCIEAKEIGINKVVAVNNDKSYYPLMHRMGIVVVRGSKAGAHYAILEKIASSSIITQRHYCGGRGVIFMRKIYPNSTLIAKTIPKVLKTEAQYFLLRNGKIYTFIDIDVFMQGDIVLVFAMIENIEKIQQWIYTL